MSPELFDPERLGLQESHRTESSDCYALGMVVYEVLSRRIPFYPYANFVVPTKVVEGKRPERPEGEEGVWFTDDVWKVLERCWTTQPGDRPGIEDVLQCLEKVSGSWTSLRVVPPPTTGSPSRNFLNTSTEGHTGLGETLTTSPYQPSQTLPAEGDAGVSDRSD